MRWEGRFQCEGERCSGDVGQQGATLVGDYPQGRVFEFFLQLWWMITRRVECLNGLFSVVSTSWQLLEDMEAEGATFGPVWACYPCRWKREKVARWEGCVPVVKGSKGKVIGDVWARQCRRQHSQALCEVVLRVLLEDMGADGANLGLLSVSVEEGKSRQVGRLCSCRGQGER